MNCVVCNNKVDWEIIKEEFEGMFNQVDWLGEDSLTDQQQTVYAGRICSYECWDKLI